MSGANARLGEQRSLAKADRPSDPWQVEELEDKRASARTAMANGEIDDLPMHQNHDRAEAFERLEPSVLQQQGHAQECIDREGCAAFANTHSQVRLGEIFRLGGLMYISAGCL